MTPEEVNEAVALKLGWDKVVGPAPMFRTIWIRKGNFGEGQQYAPTYTTDIKSAWEIVDYVASHSSDPSLKFKMTRHTSQVYAGWYIEAGGMGDDFTLAEGQAETAPMAICLAFLKLND
jgi:hypothetical protein